MERLYRRRGLLKSAGTSLVLGGGALLLGSGAPLARRVRPEAVADLRFAQTYPFAQPQSASYPEQGYARYSAAGGRWGACFSGGGPRAFSAALGQMRGLHAAGVLSQIGAISAVSGGSWFCTTFSFAPSALTDAQLLGPVVQPEQLTVRGLHQLDAPNLGALMPGLTDDSISELVTLYLAEYKFGYLPFDKIYARVLNELLLAPYGLDDTATLFTLNAATRAAIQARNPGLQADFHTLRTRTPFLIVGSTQIYPLGGTPRHPAAPGDFSNQIYRSFEYTPLYTGTPQFFAGAGPGGVDFGGGYVESFAFDTPAPVGSSAGRIAVVPEGANPFLLSDVIASSSAAVASVLDVSGYSGGFPFFHYWPVENIGKEAVSDYSFGDGGVLENTGIVPLLRRRYPVIFAFVNTPYPTGSTSTGCVGGIDGQISRLFGLIPQQNLGNSQNTQLFATAQFAELAAGLAAARAAGQAVVHGGIYPVLPGNPFEVAPYAPQIFWVYNDLDESWFNRLPAAVRDLFNDNNPENQLANFPNYATVLQNQDELLLLTPRQVNLLSQMWGYSVQKGFAQAGQAFGIEIAS